MVAFNPNIPFGLQPFRRLDGASWNDSLRRYYVPASQTSALFVGDPVVKIAGSADINGINGVNLATAGSGNSVTGVICGFQGYCAAGSGGPAILYGLPPGNAYRPASTVYDWYVLVNDDPEAEWTIQADNNTGGVIAVTFSASSAITGTGLPATAGTPVAFSNSTSAASLPSPLVAYQAGI